MRHAEDENKITHEGEDGRLGHEASTDGSVMQSRGEGTGGGSTSRHGDTSGENHMQENTTNAETPRPPNNATIPVSQGNEPVAEQPVSQPEAQNQNAGNNRNNEVDQNADIDQNGGIASRSLDRIDNIIPNDRENVTVQAIKHDALETPASILKAKKDIEGMRSRGRRSLFESGGNKKDRLPRRILDGGYIATQAAANIMPDEQQDEDSGTKGIRAMVAEGAKLARIFATAEKPKDSKMRHAEDEQRLTHEDSPEESRLGHEEPLEDESRLEHGEADGDNALQHEGSADAEATEAEADDIEINDGANEAPEGGQGEADSGGVLPNSQDVEQDSGSDNTTEAETVDTNDTDGVTEADGIGTPAPQSQTDIKAESKIDKNIDKYTGKAEKLEKKIEKAEKKIPKKKVKKSKLVHDEQTGKPKRQISFSDEKVDKADAKWNQGQSKTVAANTGRYVTGHASSFVHGKVSETENLTGNTGVKAAHTTEKGAVKTYAAAKRVQRYAKNAPYRKLHHLKAKEAQNKGKLAYQQLLKDKPELRTKTASRLIQKRRIKREYAKAFRAAQSGGKAGALGKAGAVIGVGTAAVSGDGKALAKMGFKTGLKVAFKKVSAAIGKALAPILLKIGLLLLIVGAVLLLVTMCASLFSASTDSLIGAASFTADMDDITEYSVYMTQLEADLKEKIIEAAGGDGFSLAIAYPGGAGDTVIEGPLSDPTSILPFLSDITHDPVELMAYLTAAYGDFSGHDIYAVLDEIFETAFELEIVDGEYFLTIHSTVSEVLQDRMDDGQKEHFEVLMETLGLRQFVGSPFEDDWLGSVSSVYGYRFHPITLTKQMHYGIDIAKPEGTPILSGVAGTVTFAGDNGGYGNTVIIEYHDEETGMGVRLLYAHLHEINVSVGNMPGIGETIGTVGSTGTSTGNHLHMEVSVNEDGGAWRHINPLFFVEPYPG